MDAKTMAETSGGQTVPDASALDKPFTPKDFARLIKKTAFEMNAYDKALIEAAHQEGHEYRGNGVTGGPTVDGHRIAVETARGVGLPVLGEVVYYLLAYVWNDALDWADKHGADDVPSI